MNSHKACALHAHMAQPSGLCERHANEGPAVGPSRTYHAFQGKTSQGLCQAVVMFQLQPPTRAVYGIRSRLFAAPNAIASADCLLASASCLPRPCRYMWQSTSCH